MISAERIWYGRHPLAWALAPFAGLYCALVHLRRLAYRSGMRVSHALPVPVVVVGNITVGGTGKTPLVIWLCQFLQHKGYHPGVLTRGYGGTARDWPQEVNPGSDPREVGDEAVLLARRTGCPVMAGPERRLSGRRLIETHRCDIIVADDGLQHYRLKRDIEIAVVDGERRFGNGWCLPAGPLREPIGRLREVDLVVANGAPAAQEFGMTLICDQAVSLQDPLAVCRLADFAGKEVLAVAGIGNPARFFRMLTGEGIRVTPRPYPDHYAFTADDARAWSGAPVLMTEKDAVKCERFADGDHWFVTARAEPEARFVRRFERLLEGLRNG